MLHWSLICLVTKNYYYFLCDTREKKFAIRFIAFARTKILNFRNSSFSNLLSVSCPRNDVLTKHLQIFKGNGFWGNFEEFKFSTLAERHKRQDFMDVFRTYKGFTRLSIDKLYERDANIKGTRGIH